MSRVKRKRILSEKDVIEQAIDEMRRGGLM